MSESYAKFGLDLVLADVELYVAGLYETQDLRVGLVAASVAALVLAAVVGPRENRHPDVVRQVNHDRDQCLSVLGDLLAVVVPDRL